ncbi:hypothetical protein BDZ97DRAFT_2053799 [Flammula alnicola]|nr:hypothetical protein BDZ97DRAFT_2053799 [Flammula alnicola]
MDQHESNVNPPKCKHDIEARLLTTKNQKSPNVGREFYRCALDRSLQCDFFAWQDQLDLVPRNNLPLTPQSQKSSQSQHHLEHPSSPTPAQPPKRTFSAADGPRDNEEYLTSTGSQKKAKVIKIPSENCLSFSQNSNNDHESDGEPSFHNTLKPAYNEDRSEKYWSPRTPPRSHEKVSIFTRASPPISSDLAVPGNRNAPNTPSYLSGASPQETSRGGNVENLTTDGICDLILRLKDVPDFIHKLERKKKAAERSRDIKAKKIIDLEKEIERKPRLFGIAGVFILSMKTEYWAFWR